MDDKKTWRYYTGHPMYTRSGAAGQDKEYLNSEVNASEDTTCEVSSSSLWSTREGSAPTWTESQFLEALDMCEHTNRYQKRGKPHWMVHVFRTGRRYAVSMHRTEYNRVEMTWKREGNEREHVTVIQTGLVMDSPEARSILRQMYDDISKKWK